MAARKHAELIKQLADDDSLEIQVLNHKNEWSDASIGSIFTWPNYEYRIKPTKPSIDWEHVADDYVQMATDANGSTYLHQSGDMVDRGYGWANKNDALKYVSADGFSSFKAGTCDWKDSLVKRPEGE